MTGTAQDIIAGVEVLTIVTECYGVGGPGGMDKRGETKMTVGHLEQWSILPRGGTTSGAVCNLIAVFHRFFCGRCFGQNCRGPSPLCGGHPLQDYQPPQVVDEVL